MFSLKLVLCVCIFFVIGMKAEPKPQPKAEPKPFPPIRYTPHSGGFNLPGANPGPWNLNGFPPTRGANSGPWNWNGFPPTRGYYPWQRNWNRKRKRIMTSDGVRYDDDGCRMDGLGRVQPPIGSGQRFWKDKSGFHYQDLGDDFGMDKMCVIMRAVEDIWTPIKTDRRKPRKPIPGYVDCMHEPNKGDPNYVDCEKWPSFISDDIRPLDEYMYLIEF